VRALALAYGEGMHWTTRTLPLALACLVACGDSGKTSDSGTGDGSSSTNGASTGAASTSTAGTASTDASGGGTEGQTSSTSTTASTTSTSSSSSSSSSTGEPGTTSTTGGSTSTTGSTGPDSTGGSTGGLCAGQGQSCAMGEACCNGLDCCAGIPVPPGKEFCSNNCPISDRNAKADFRPIDVQDVLARVAALDITTWRYKKDTPDVRHLGPMAQDFKAAFGLGDTDRMIFPLDATGVSLAAIQALHQRLGAAEAENDALRDRLGRLERRLAELEAR